MEVPAAFDGFVEFNKRVSSRVSFKRKSTIARQAVAEFAAVSGIFREVSHARYYELSEEQRARTLKPLSELGQGGDIDAVQSGTPASCERCR